MLAALPAEKVAQGSSHAHHATVSETMLDEAFGPFQTVESVGGDENFLNWKGLVLVRALELAASDEDAEHKIRSLLTNNSASTEACFERNAIYGDVDDLFEDEVSVAFEVGQQGQITSVDIAKK